MFGIPTENPVEVVAFRIPFDNWTIENDDPLITVTPVNEELFIPNNSIGYTLENSNVFVLDVYLNIPCLAWIFLKSLLIT